MPISVTDLINLNAILATTNLYRIYYLPTLVQASVQVCKPFLKSSLRLMVGKYHPYKLNVTFSFQSYPSNSPTNICNEYNYLILM